jgi:hypothetical protein
VKGVFKASQIQKIEIEGEKNSGSYQPKNNQG